MNQYKNRVVVDIKGGRCRELLAVLDEVQADELLARFGGSSLPF